MAAPILPTSNIPPIAPEVPAVTGAASNGGGFRAALEGAIGRVEAEQRNAAQSVEKFLSGDGGELHTTILSTQRADLAFRMFMQFRNKVVDAYQEIMRMQP